jgi:5-methylcytosine-specific restriction endonuclease McrA
VAHRDRRYSTARWQRLRRAILIRDGRICQVRGPRCTRLATTVHHIWPSSQYPELFWHPENLQSSCRPCNNHGGNVKAENRVNRRTIAHLEQIIEEQEAELEELRVALAEDNSREPPMPGIY